MQLTTNKKMSNASDCYSVAKSHQEHNGSLSKYCIYEPWWRFEVRSYCLQKSASACGLTHGCVTMPSGYQGCELSNFALIV